MPQRLRDRLVVKLGALTPEQQRLLIEFIWLREHTPPERGERIQKWIMEMLDSPQVLGDEVTSALERAVKALREPMSSEPGAGAASDV